MWKEGGSLEGLVHAVEVSDEQHTPIRVVCAQPLSACPLRGRARGDSLKPNSPSESVYVWMTLLKSGKSAVVCVQHSLAAFVRGLSLRGVP